MSEIKEKMVLNDKPVALSYTISRVERIEAATGKSIASMFQSGTLQINEIKTLVGMALRYDDGGFVSPQQGMAFAEELLQETSYAAVTSMITTALERDCPFYFRID